VVIGHDVTDQEKAHRGVQALYAVRERVGQTLDVVATCQELVHALVPGFADIAVVEVVEPVVRGDEPPLSPLGRDVPLRRAAFGNGNGDQHARAHPVGDVRALPFPTPYAQALADLKPRTIALRSDTPWLTGDPARAEAMRASGVRFLLVTPLTLRGKVLGLLSLYRTGRCGRLRRQGGRPHPGTVHAHRPEHRQRPPLHPRAHHRSDTAARTGALRWVSCR
jgi:GAF domain-containing protein